MNKKDLEDEKNLKNLNEKKEKKLIEKEKELCEICLKNNSKYKCPKCFKFYCCLECYKSPTHLECSENFYKNCCFETIKAEQDFDRKKEEVIKMVKKVYEENDEEKMEEKLNDIFDEMNLGVESENMWNLLHVEEKAYFIQMHQNNKFSKILFPWKPWWFQKTSSLIEDEENIDKVISKIPQPIKSTLSKLPETLSPTLPYDIINLIFGFCYVSRFFNGDPFDLPSDSSHLFLFLSHSLHHSSFSSVTMAINHCLLNLTSGRNFDKFLISWDFNMLVLKDIFIILKGLNKFKKNFFILSTLSESKKIFKLAANYLKKKKEINERNICIKSYRKIDFYLKFVEENGEKLDGLEEEVLLEIKKKEQEKEKMESESQIMNENLHFLREKSNLKSKKIEFIN